MELTALGRMRLEHPEQEGGRKLGRNRWPSIYFVNREKGHTNQGFSYHIFYLRISILLL